MIIVHVNLYKHITKGTEQKFQNTHLEYFQKQNKNIQENTGSCIAWEKITTHIS